MMDSPVDDSLDDESASAEFFGLPRLSQSNRESAQDPLDLAVSEFLEAIRKGKHPSIDEFASRFPKRASEIRELLTVAAAVESWKIGKEQTTALRSLPTQGKYPDIGGCRLTRELGRGGMGVVYEGVELASGERVAVKLMSWRDSSDLIRSRFQQEARVTAKLRHPNIVPVIRYGEEQGWCYHVMPLIEGLPLDQVIELLRHPDGSLSADTIRQRFHSETTSASGADAPRVLAKHGWTAIAKIGIQAATALSYAHEQAVLHRDIKPANLLLNHQGTVFVADFGVAIDWDALLTRQPLQLAGTLAYVAPELLDGHADERSDIYSLGVTLYELCSLHSAYRADTTSSLFEKVKQASPVRLRQIVPTIPVDFERIILRSMARIPAQRFQSAGDLRTALARFVKDQL